MSIPRWLILQHLGLWSIFQGASNVIRAAGAEVTSATHGRLPVPREPQKEGWRWLSTESGDLRRCLFHLWNFMNMNEYEWILFRHCMSLFSKSDGDITESASFSTIECYRTTATAVSMFRWLPSLTPKESRRLAWSLRMKCQRVLGFLDLFWF